MKKFLRFLQSTMEMPLPYGAFHLVAVAAVLITAFLVCFFFRDASEKSYRTILFVIWVIIFLFEMVKQLMESYYFLPNGDIVWDYQWYAFPLQLCSSPLYTLPLIVFLKDGKARRAISAYSYTFVLLGGLATYIFPQTTFCPFVYINVQTLVHHGLQIVSAVFIAVHNRKKLITFRAFLSAFFVFLIAVAIAISFNEGINALFPNEMPKVDMFYIDRRSVKKMPLEAFDNAWVRIPWACKVLIYIAGLTGLAFIIFMVFFTINHFLKRRAAQQA